MVISEGTHGYIRGNIWMYLRACRDTTDKHAEGRNAADAWDTMHHL